MPQTKLVAAARHEKGSAAARRLRADGKIPAVLYGHGMEAAPITIGRRDLRGAVAGAAGFNTILDIEVDGSVYPSIIKELQRHPVRHSVTHVDFIQVNLDEEITIHVPLRLEGEAEHVSGQGGLVDPAVDSIEVVTTPRNIPPEFVVDVSNMEMDTVIRLEDLTMPSGVTPTGEPDMPVVTVLTMAAELAEIEALDEEIAAEQAEEAEAGVDQAAKEEGDGSGDADGGRDASDASGDAAE